MKLKFWGVRGSIPTPPTNDQIKHKFRELIRLIPLEILKDDEKLNAYLDELSPVQYGLLGGNTACISVECDDKFLIFDMGTGIVKLGNMLVEKQNNKSLDLHIFVTHTHWDHMMGFPLFKPAYYPQNNLTFYSPHPNFQDRVELQQDFRFFPVSLEKMSAKKAFVPLEHRSCIDLGKVKICNFPQHHPGGSFGYRIECNKKSIVYATDTEYRDLNSEAVRKNIKMFQGADLVVFDAQYTFEEAIHKEDWGHSSALIGIDIAIEADVKRLALFHHEPDRDDFEVEAILKKAINYKKMNYPQSELDVFLASEDTTIDL